MCRKTKHPIMNYIKKTDCIRWFLTIVFIVYIFRDAGFIVGIFAIAVFIEMELSTIYRRIDAEWKNLIMKIYKE